MKFGNLILCICVDPTNLAIRYIGKGTGNRALSHLDSNEESEKVEWIQGLKEVGKEPRIDIIARNLTEENALLIERSLIDVIGLGYGKLTNKVRGHDVQSGRESIQEIAIKLNPQQADFKHMRRLNQHWRPNFHLGELIKICMIYSEGDLLNKKGIEKLVYSIKHQFSVEFQQTCSSLFQNNSG